MIGRGYAASLEGLYHRGLTRWVLLQFEILLALR
jgi:hypothetical protein